MTDKKTAGIKILTVGNALTLARLVLLPIIIAGIALNIGYLSVAGMAAAMATDLLDGRISRRMGTASDFGRNLDSSIDFILLHSIFIAFYAVHKIHTAQFAVIYTVMLSTLALQMVTSSVAEDKGVIRTKFGKPTGAFEYSYLLFLVIRQVLTPAPMLEWINWGIFGGIALFGVMYIFECIARLKKLV